MLLLFFIAAAFSCLSFVVASAPLRVIRVRTTNQIKNAIANARAGDEIVVAPGTYSFPSSLRGRADGTAELPIILRGENSLEEKHKRPSILTGPDPGRVTLLHIFGAHWTIQDLHITKASRGIIYDNAPYGKVLDSWVYNTGSEAIHWRDGSDFGLIERCKVFDAGVRRPGVGEGIYIGSDHKHWQYYDYDVTYITVRNCTIGPNVGAEALDIKEGTSEIVIEYNTFDATGISNENYADSFIDLKGLRAYIRYNKFLRNGEAKLKKGIAIVDRPVQLSSYHHSIHDNEFHLDDDGSNIAMVHSQGRAGDVYAWNNARFPSDGRVYRGRQVLDFCCPAWYSPPYDETSCSPPALVRANYISGQSRPLFLRWDNANNAKSYNVVLKKMNDIQLETSFIQTNGIEVPYFNPAGLERNTIYVARVQSVCQFLQSEFSSEVFFTSTYQMTAQDAMGLGNSLVSVAVAPLLEGPGIVYFGNLGFGWSQHSYGGNFNFRYPETLDNQQYYFIRADLNKYGGLRLVNAPSSIPKGVSTGNNFISASNSNNTIQVNDNGSFRFWIRDNQFNGPASPSFHVLVNAKRTKQFKIPSPGWHPISVPLDDGDDLVQIEIQSRSNRPRTVYFDVFEVFPPTPLFQSDDAPQQTIQEARTAVVARLNTRL